MEEIALELPRAKKAVCDRRRVVVVVDVEERLSMALKEGLVGFDVVFVDSEREVVMRHTTCQDYPPESQ